MKTNDQVNPVAASNQPQPNSVDPQLGLNALLGDSVILPFGTIVELRSWDENGRNRALMSEDYWKVKSTVGNMTCCIRPYVDGTDLEMVVPTNWLRDPIQIIKDKITQDCCSVK